MLKDNRLLSLYPTSGKCHLSSESKKGMASTPARQKSERRPPTLWTRYQLFHSWN